MRNAGLEEAQAGIKIAGRTNNNLRYADDTTVTTESEEIKNNISGVFTSEVKIKKKKKSLSLFPLFPHLFAMK